MRNRKRRKKRWKQDVTFSFGVIASIESHNNADNKLECCLHSLKKKVFSVLSMRLESDVDHLFFISNNSRTKHKTVKAISKQAPKELDDRHCLRLHHFLSQNSVPSYFLRFLFLAIKIITTVNGYVAVNFCFQ